MTQLTIAIPDYLARQLESVAAAQRKSVEQVALERLDAPSGARDGSPQALLRIVMEPPHISSALMDDFDAAIAAGQLPVREAGAFER